MKFRDLPAKRRLVLMVPEDVFEKVRDETHASRRSRSEVGSIALAKGLGFSPKWLKSLKDEGRPVAV